MKQSVLLLLAFPLLLAACDRAAEVAGFSSGSTGADEAFTLTVGGDGPPTLEARIESRGATDTLRRIASRGAHTIWRASGGQTITLTEGVVTATTALTPDLFSVDTSLPSEWLASPRPASSTRIHHYVDGDENEIIRGYRCVISADQPEDLTISGVAVATRRIDETCQNATQSFTNAYWLDDAGRMVQSRQWLSQDLGYLRLNNSAP